MSPNFRTPSAKGGCTSFTGVWAECAGPPACGCRHGSARVQGNTHTHACTRTHTRTHCTGVGGGGAGSGSPSLTKLESSLFSRVLSQGDERPGRRTRLAGAAGRAIPGAPLASAARLGHSSRPAGPPEHSVPLAPPPNQTPCAPAGPSAAPRLEGAEFSRNCEHCALTEAPSPAACPALRETHGEGGQG